DTMVAFGNYLLSADALESVASGLRVSVVTITDASHYPLTLLAVPGNRLSLRLDYQPGVFDPADADRIMSTVVRVLEAFKSDLATPVWQLDVLSADDRRRVLEDWNDTHRPVTRATIPDLFEAQVIVAPTATAVVGLDGRSTTYASLNASANQLARLLVSRGVGPESVVGLALSR